MVGLRNGAGEDLNVTAVAGVINAPSAFYRGYPIQNLTGLVSMHCTWLGLDLMMFGSSGSHPGIRLMSMQCTQTGGQAPQWPALVCTCETSACVVRHAAP